jgi:putative ABC transport system substrate-binding protein
MLKPRPSAPDLAAELVRLVDVILTSSTPAIQAAKSNGNNSTVTALRGDPVGTGLVASLAKPAENITGLRHWP